MEDRLYTPKEISAKYGISIFTVYKWVSLKSIPYIKLKRAVRFRPKDLKNWEDNNLIVANEELL